MRRVLLAMACSVALLAGPAVSPVGAVEVGSFDAKLHQFTNQARDNHDRRGLKFGRCLDRYAQRQANRMARQERMYHQNLGVVLKKCRARTVGENVAYGFASARRNVRAWMKSPGHRRNILDRRYTRLGIGVAVSESGTTYTAQVFGRPA